MKIAISLTLFFLSFCALAQEQASNYKTKKVAVRDSIKIDSVSINSSKFIVRTKSNIIIDSSKYTIDFSKAVLTFKQPIQSDSIHY